MATRGSLNELNLAKEQDGDDGQLERVESSTSLLPETQLFELNKKVKHLELKLQETLATVKTKEQKVWELELVLSNLNFQKMEAASTHVSALEERKEEVKSELEVLLKKKMEAEIEYLILRRTSPSWKAASEYHIALLDELRYLAGFQEQMMLKLRVAEDQTIKLSERTDKLGAYSKELVGTEYVLRLQHKIFRGPVWGPLRDNGAPPLQTYAFLRGLDVRSTVQQQHYFAASCRKKAAFRNQDPAFVFPNITV